MEFGEELYQSMRCQWCMIMTHSCCKDFNVVFYKNSLIAVKLLSNKAFYDSSHQASKNVPIQLYN